MSGTTFSFRVDSELKDAFTQKAKEHGLTPAELFRCFMRDVVARGQASLENGAGVLQKLEAMREGEEFGRGSSKK